MAKEDLTTDKGRTKYWTAYAKEKLVGKTIKSVRYMTPKEAEDWMWYKRPLVMTLSDGTNLILSCDDEGNDGGAMFGQTKDEEFTFPVLS